ncbi:MAG: hypothetical protein ABEK17_03595 [Candidatus Aenigmatarchaeota archaeon]
MERKFVVFVILGLLLITFSLAAGVKLVDPPTGLYFNNTSVYSGDAKFYRNSHPKISAKWNESVNETKISVFFLNSTGTYHMQTCTHNSTNNCISSLDLKNQTFNDSWTNYSATENSRILGKLMFRINVTSTLESGSAAHNYTQDNLTTWGWSEINSSYSTYPAYMASENASVGVKVSDNITNVGIGNYLVNFYVNGIGQGSSKTNSDGWVQYEFNETDGIYNVTYNISDNSSLFYESSSNNAGSMNIIFDNPGVYSTNRNFSATPSPLLFNWTSGNFTLKSYVNSSRLYINNESTNIESDSYQSSRFSDYDALSVNYGYCFDENKDTLKFLVKNNSHYTSNSTSLGFDEEELFETSILSSCPPGKYSGNFTISQISNTNEVLSVNTTVDIPINSENSLYVDSRNATFLTAFGSTNLDYQSFYFNTSSIENITGATFTLDNFASDFDIFVFNNTGSLVDKSINKGLKREKVTFVELPDTSEMWEIRIFGNSSSYDELRGDIFYTVLNSTKSSLDFGNLNVSETGTDTFTLKNEYNDTLDNIQEYREIYREKTWESENTSNDFKLLVPPFARKLKVSVTWDGENGENVTDWDLFLTDPNNNSILNSTDKFVNANITDATREEFVTHLGAFNTSNDGYWNVSVRNQTNEPLSNYTVSSKVWVNNSWISTNFTSSGYNFNRTNTVGHTYSVGVNVSVPENSLYGDYSGQLIYNNSEGWNYLIPLSFHVNSSMFVVEDELEETTKEIGVDNIGFNKIGNKAKTLNLTIENKGEYDLNWNNSSSGILRKNSNENNITLNIEWPSQPIGPGENKVVNITAPINTSLTNNVPGIYRGWIFFNTTNQTNPSYPYTSYNISLTLNLTDKLNVEIYGINTSNGDNWYNASIAENITYLTKIKLINGTEITSDEGGIQSLGPDNFTAAWMNETNVTSRGYDLGEPTQAISTDISTLCDTNYCKVNTTVPSGVVGGRYQMAIEVQWNGSETESLLSGFGTYKKLIVNNPGLYFNNVPEDIYLDQEESSEINISIINYGPMTSSEDITLEGCGDYIENIGSGGDCSGGSYGDRSIGSPDIYGNGSSCNVWWTFDTENVSDDRECTFNLSTSAPILNTVDDLSFVLDITDTDDDSVDETTTTTEEEESSSSSSSDTTSTTIDEDDINREVKLSLEPETLSIQQGNVSSMKVIVKNIGDILLDELVLDVGEIPKSWADITPMEMNGLEIDEEEHFTVDIQPSLKSPIKEYVVEFVVSNDDVTESIKGTIRVTPSPNKCEELNASYHTYLDKYENFTEEMESLKESGKNIDELNKTVVNLKNKLDEVKESIDERDYFAVNQKMSEAETLIEETEKEIERAGQVSKGGIPLWAILISVVIAIIVGSFFVYMFLPSEEGYKSGRGYIYKPPKEESFFTSLSENIKEGLVVFKKKLGVGHKHDYDYTRRDKWKKKEEEE